MLSELIYLVFIVLEDMLWLWSYNTVDIAAVGLLYYDNKVLRRLNVRKEWHFIGETIIFIGT